MKLGYFSIILSIKHLARINHKNLEREVNFRKNFRTRKERSILAAICKPLTKTERKHIHVSSIKVMRQKLKQYEPPQTYAK